MHRQSGELDTPLATCPDGTCAAAERGHVQPVPLCESNQRRSEGDRLRMRDAAGCKHAQDDVCGNDACTVAGEEYSGGRGLAIMSKEGDGSADTY